MDDHEEYTYEEYDLVDLTPDMRGIYGNALGKIRQNDAVLYAMLSNGVTVSFDDDQIIIEPEDHGVHEILKKKKQYIDELVGGDIIIMKEKRKKVENKKTAKLQQIFGGKINIIKDEK